MYHFQDKVKIIKGFYKGYKGIVIDVENDIEDTNIALNKYEVEITIEEKNSSYLPDTVKIVIIREDYLNFQY